MKRRRSGLEDDSAVDLTPMLDVVFILLIFFIVTATFVRERGIDVLRPDNNEEQQTTSVFPILVFINSNNDVQVNDPRTGEPRTIDVRAVRANVERLRVDNPKGPVVIQAQPDADMGVTMRVLDQARLAKAPSVTISTVEN